MRVPALLLGADIVRIRTVRAISGSSKRRHRDLAADPDRRGRPGGRGAAGRPRPMCQVWALPISRRPSPIRSGSAGHRHSCAGQLEVICGHGLCRQHLGVARRSGDDTTFARPTPGQRNAADHAHLLLQRSVPVAPAGGRQRRRLLADLAGRPGCLRTVGERPTSALERRRRFVDLRPPELHASGWQPG